MTKKRFLLIFFVITLLVTIALLLWRCIGFENTKKQPASPREVAQHGSIDNAYSIHTPYGMKKRSDSSDDMQQEFSSAAFQEKMREMITVVNHPVVFYGKVVDQHGDGIEGVYVHLDTTRDAFLDSGYVESGIYEFFVKTDAGGLFSVQGFNAANISVKALEKTGYMSLKSEMIEASYFTGPVGLNIPIDKPQVFHMWKIEGEPISLVKRNFFKQLYNDGTPQSFRLGSNTQDFGTLNVALSTDKASYSADGQRWNWSFTLEMTEGGIILTDDSLPCNAPESGYKSKVFLLIDANEPNWKKEMQLTAYVVGGNPACYSRVIIEVNSTIRSNVNRSDRNKILNLEIHSFTNPTGTRILPPEEGFSLQK